MDNVRPEGTEDQSDTSPSREALGRSVHVRRYECIRKSPQQYDPGFGSAREWKKDSVASIVYIIQDEDFNTIVDTYDILACMRHQSFI